MGRDEDNRHFTTAGHQATVEFDPTHPRHTDIQYQAVAIARVIRIQELLGRAENLHSEPHRPQQTLKGFADGLVIINHRNKGRICHPRLITSVLEEKSITPWS